MTTAELLIRWYRALYKRDCVKVMQLLEEEPSLVLEGWKADPSRWSSGYPHGVESNAGKWLGRTALHVGAERGCVDLIKKVLLLFNIEAVRNYGVMEEQDTGATQSREEIVATPGQSIAEIGENDVDNLGYSVTRVNLRELLLSKHGTVGLEALAMAGIHYNEDIVNLLIYALGECDNPPYNIKKERTLSSHVSCDKEMAGRLDSLRKTTAEFIASLESEFLWLLEKYNDDCDFNFLPREEYFFHFLSGLQGQLFPEPQIRSTRTDLWKELRLLEGSLWKFVLELKDGQGRTPFNVAVANGKAVDFLEMFTDGDREMVICALTAHDRAGRSPLHRAVCSPDDVDVILSYCEKYEEVLATCHTTWRPQLGQLRIYFDGWCKTFGRRSRYGNVLRNMGMSYGCTSYTQGFKPLHAAIIHGNYGNAKRFIQEYAGLGCLKDSWYFIEYDLPGTDKQIHFENLQTRVIAWGLIEFAFLVEADMEFIQYLLKEWPSLSKLILKGDNCSTYDLKTDIDLHIGLDPDWEEYLKENILKEPWKAVHIAASAGNYEMLRLFTDNSQYDPLIEDFEGNNGLHHAMNVRQFGNFRKHILDFVNLESVTNELQEQKRKQRQSLKNAQLKNQKDVKKGKIVEREGCINLLLKVGCDLFQYNKKKQVPDPQGDLIKDGEFCSWWYDKQEKEVGAIQNKLNIASNAISVTAALVATASYVGPLQPPLGYVADPTNQIQDNNVWVAIFVFCDTSSFYLAIIAIILALIPSLPMWQQPVIEEVRKTQVMVTLAVSFLLPSIACVLIAFASSSMAVVSAGLISSIGGRLTIASLCIYAPLMVVAFFLFLVRLLGSLFPRHRWVSSMYKRCI